jgi:cobalamin biosynthesis Mg chelatase CobN
MQSERSTPPFGLTLAAMNGMRLRPNGFSGLVLGSVSALVLLAFACFPVLSQADSSEAQYSNPVPTATGNPHPAHHEPVATKSDDTGGTSTTPAGGGSASNRSEVGSGKGSSPAHGGSPGGAAPKSGTAQGSPAPGSAGKKAPPPQQGAQAGKPASQSDDGSSPLAPILIAILVLAGISLGIVIVRQRRRRQAGGPSVSPKAS